MALFKKKNRYNPDDYKKIEVPVKEPYVRLTGVRRFAWTVEIVDEGKQLGASAYEWDYSTYPYSHSFVWRSRTFKFSKSAAERWGKKWLARYINIVNHQNVREELR